MRLANVRVVGVFALAGLVAACAGGTSGVSAYVAPPEITLQGQRLFPESITSDAAGNLYIGSNPGIIFRATAGETIAQPWIVPDAANGLMSVFGVLADDVRGLLWVCTNPAGPGGGRPSIKAFSLADGHLVASHSLGTGDGPAQSPAMCNDMTIAANGDVYATETLGGSILRLVDIPTALETEDGGLILMERFDTPFEVWAIDPEFATADGIAMAEDGTLYMNAIQRNNLVRVNVDAAGNFAGATVLTPSRPMGGPDGLRLLSGHRFLQSEGNAGLITVVTIDGDRADIQTIAEGVDYASSVTAVNGRAFYPEGKLRFLFGPLAGQDPGPFIVHNAAIPEAE